MSNADFCQYLSTFPRLQKRGVPFPNERRLVEACICILPFTGKDGVKEFLLDIALERLEFQDAVEWVDKFYLDHDAEIEGSI